MTPDQKNATRRIKNQIQTFSPPVEVVTPVEESIEYFKVQLAQLQAQNDDLTTRLKLAQGIVRGKRACLANLNKALLRAEDQGQGLKKAISTETARQKNITYNAKRAIANRKRG